MKFNERPRRSLMLLAMVTLLSALVACDHDTPRPAERPYTIKVMEGKAYFEVPPASRVKSVFFTDSLTGDITELRCGCHTSCGYTHVWSQPQTSKITFRDYGAGRPMLLEIENLETEVSIKFAPC